MTQQEKQLIELLNSTTINPANIPIELVEAVQKFRKQILQVPEPIFTENGISVMKYWEDWKYSGMNNIDYVTCRFWEDGFKEEF